MNAIKLDADHLKAAFEQFLDRLTTFDFEVFDDLWAGDAHQVNPFAPDGFPDAYPTGRNAIRDVYKKNFSGHANVHFHNRKLFADEAQQAVFATFDGRVTPKSGAVLETRYAVLIEFDDAGKIRAYAEYFNPDFVLSVMEEGKK